LREGQINLERCLRALDQKGEAGHQRELDRRFPGTTAPNLQSEVTTPAGIRLHYTYKPGFSLPTKRYGRERKHV